MNDSSMPSTNDQKQGSSTATTNPVAPTVKFRSVSAGSNGNAAVKRLEAPAPEDDPLEQSSEKYGANKDASPSKYA